MVISRKQMEKDLGPEDAYDEDEDEDKYWYWIEKTVKYIFRM